MSDIITPEEMSSHLVSESTFEWGRRIGMAELAKVLSKIIRESIGHQNKDDFYTAAADLFRNSKNPKTPLGVKLLAAMRKANEKIMKQPEEETSDSSDSDDPDKKSIKTAPLGGPKPRHGPGSDGPGGPGGPAPPGAGKGGKRRRHKSRKSKSKKRARKTRRRY